MDRPKIEDYFTNEKFKFANKFGYNITFDSGLYEQALNSYIDQLEKAYEDVKKGLDNACNKLEGLYLCIDVLTDKESKKDKEYWKKKVNEDVH